MDDDGARQEIVTRTKKILTVIEGYRIKEAPVGYPDKNDLHVHSAAVCCAADVLITDDKKLLDFAKTEKGESQLPYETMSCDDFLMQLTDYAPLKLFADTYLKQEKYWEKKKDARPIPEQLVSATAPKFATYLRQHVIHTLP